MLASVITFGVQSHSYAFVHICMPWFEMCNLIRHESEKLPANVNHNMCAMKCEHMLADVNTLCNENCKTVVIKLCLMSRANLIRNLENCKTVKLLSSSFARNCTLQKFQVNMQTHSYSKYDHEPLYLLCHQM